jgi:hypothetical protein
MEWIRQNIANFGGDPSRITMWGQSAGAASTDVRKPRFDCFSFHTCFYISSFIVRRRNLSQSTYLKANTLDP